MTKTFKNKILNIEDPKKKVFWSFVMFAIMFSGLYLYYVNRTIINVVERQNIEKQIANINSRISDTEISYMNLKNNINYEFAVSKGFVRVSNEKYVSRRASGDNLSVNRI